MNRHGRGRPHRSVQRRSLRCPMWWTCPSSTTRRPEPRTDWPKRPRRPRRKAGAETRLRKVRELEPDEAIATNAGWAAHARETQDVPEAPLDDRDWADAIVRR